MSTIISAALAVVLFIIGVYVLVQSFRLQSAARWMLVVVALALCSGALVCVHIVQV